MTEHTHMYYPNQIEYDRVLDQFLSAIFPSEPVYSSPFFVPSYTMQTRWSLHPPMDSTPRCLRGPGDYIDFNGLLGPYEFDLLRQIVTVGGRVVPVRGGARSGKSSTLRVICNALHSEPQHLAALFRLDQLRVFFVDGLNFGGHPQVDSAEARIHVSSMSPAEYIKELACLLTKALFKDSRGIDNLAHILVTTFNKMYKEYLGIDRVIGFVEPAFEYLNQIKNRKRSEIIALLLEYITALESDERQLITALSLYCVLGSYLSENNGKVILVIDNIDQFEEHFQIDFFDVCRKATGSEIWNNFKMVLPLRLATYSRITQCLHWAYPIEHEAPSPVDIILSRLRHFFTNPTHYCHPSSFNPAVYNHAISRLVMLWAHLSDNNGLFRQMLSSMAGTNIRNAFRFVERWVKGRLLPPTNATTNLLIKCGGDIDRSICESLLRDMWDTAIANLNWLHEEVFERKTVIGTKIDLMIIESIAEEVVSRFCSYLSNIIADFSRMPMPSANNATPPHYSFNCALSLNLADILENQIDSLHDDYRRLVMVQARELLFSISKHVVDYDDIGLYLNSFAKALSEKLSSYFSVANKGIDCTEAEILSDKYLEWLLIIVAQTKLCPKDVKDIPPRKMADQDKLPYRLCIKEHGGDLSRFIAGVQLLAPELKHPDDESGPINIFQGNTPQSQLVITHLLYLLYSNEVFSLPVRILNDDLVLLGHDPSDIELAVQMLTHLDTRLIFSSLRDHFKGAEHIFKNKTSKLSLSTSGKLYIEKLIICPPYLFWAFCGVPRKRNDFYRAFPSVYDRISHVYNGIFGLIHAEERMYEGCVATLRRGRVNGIIREMENHIPTVKSPMLDICIRTMYSHVFSLRSYYKQVEGTDPNRAKKTKALMRDWHQEALSRYNRLCGTYTGYRNAAWENELDWTKGIIQKL